MSAWRARRTWSRSGPRCGPPTWTAPAACRRRPRPPAPRPRVPDPPPTVDVLLDAFAIRFTQGYAAAAPTLTRALERVLALNVGTAEAGGWLWLAGPGAGGMVALEVWDDASWHALAAREVQVARDTGALVHLQSALDFLARAHLLTGELVIAARLIEEDRLIAEATGNPPVAYTAMTLAAWRGQQAQALDLIEATVQEATARGLGRPLNFAAYASAVLHNGLSPTTPRATPPGGRSSTISWGTGRLWCPSWPRRHPGPVTRRSSGPRSSGCPNARASPLPSGRWASKPASAPCSAKATPPSVCTASRSPGSAGLASARSSPAPTCCMANGCAASAAAPTRGSSCAPRTTCWKRWASGRSPSGPGVSWRRPARPPASAPPRPAIS